MVPWSQGRTQAAGAGESKMFTFPGCWRGDRMDKGPEVGCLALAGDQRAGGVLGRGRCEDEKAWTCRAQDLRTGARAERDIPCSDSISTLSP